MFTWHIQHSVLLFLGLRGTRADRLIRFAYIGEQPAFHGDAGNALNLDRVLESRDPHAVEPL
jgi:hypothetical protein